MLHSVRKTYKTENTFVIRGNNQPRSRMQQDLRQKLSWHDICRLTCDKSLCNATKLKILAIRKSS